MRLAPKTAGRGPEGISGHSFCAAKVGGKGEEDPVLGSGATFPSPQAWVCRWQPDLAVQTEEDIWGPNTVIFLPSPPPACEGRLGPALGLGGGRGRKLERGSQTKTCSLCSWAFSEKDPPHPEEALHVSLWKGEDCPKFPRESQPAEGCRASYGFSGEFAWIVA